MKIQKIQIARVPCLILRPSGMRGPDAPTPALLWIHGGGYATGMKEMVFIGRAARLVDQYGVTVISPGYRLSWQAPYPAAIRDCYRVLVSVAGHARRVGIRADQIMVGGESAGGGLAAALCMAARDHSDVKIAWQFPLYPMLSSLDTETSRDNHGRIWNTRRNHLAWKMYLREKNGKIVSPYASPIMQRDYHGLPPAYTFVGDGEPFYAETLEYISRLNEAGVEAEVDVYHTDMHAFDMLRPKMALSKAAIRAFEKKFEYALMTIGS